MLNLLRSKGQVIFIGDDPLTVIEIASSYTVVKYLEALHVLRKGEPFNLTPTTIAKFINRSRSGAFIGLRSTSPIYRSEIYEKRNNKSPT